MGRSEWFNYLLESSYNDVIIRFNKNSIDSSEKQFYKVKTTDDSRNILTICKCDSWTFFSRTKCLNFCFSQQYDEIQCCDTYSSVYKFLKLSATFGIHSSLLQCFENILYKTQSTKHIKYINIIGRLMTRSLVLSKINWGFERNHFKNETSPSSPSISSFIILQ